MKCKCKLIEEYWNAIGTSKHGYYNRRDILYTVILGAIPIIGQMLCIIILVFSYNEARREDCQVPKEYRQDYIKKLIKKNNKKEKKNG